MEDTMGRTATQFGPAELEPGLEQGQDTGLEPGRDASGKAAESTGEEGIATAEFAIVTLAAVGFAGLLVTILSSGDVRELLMGLVRQALSY
ncbi:DUF4244 domain-containing protein [Zafaria sp. Z1313]|uniref:DUF4244 domain-containing protein n=1 Tax=unclassified Zafaria TaxID=2828765 RepID=UPI002E78C58A|nr:DUF4244 domain-containing protein [Zafaria sp. J156]MEE1621348.1 DUF4244 domain-containing protein [Zafaria sp. J156]